MPRRIEEPTRVESERYGIDHIVREQHPAFGLIGASRGTAGPPGAVMFDSELPHRDVITVTIRSAERERALNHDRITSKEGSRADAVIASVAMSEVQWAQFISTMNQGYGTPCTIQTRDGDWDIPGLPLEARLQESMEDVRTAGERAVEKIEKALKAVEEKPTKANIRHLRAMVDNAPGNLEFAAKSLTEHTENVVTKARHDIEQMVIREAERRGLDPAELSVPQLTVGADDIEEAEIVPDPAEAEKVED